MSDERERIAQLRDDLDRDLQGYEAGQAALGPVSAGDRTGSVQVRLSADGVLESVEVSAVFRRHLDAASLPSAVLEAYSAAALERSNAFYGTAADTEPGRPRPEPAGPRLTDEVVERMTERGRDLPPSMLQAMSDLLDDLNRSVDEAFGMVDEQLSSTVRGRSSSGHVEAEVSGTGTITGLTYDEKWLETAHTFNVGRETTEAVHDAMRRQAGQAGATVADASGLTRLQQLTSDPAALTRYLGLDT